MRARFLGMSALLLLSACGSTQSVTYRLEIDEQANNMQKTLVEQSRRVVASRLERLGEDAGDIVIRMEEESPLLEVPISSDAIAATLTDELTEPFTLRIMAETTPDEADITVEGHGGFRETGITQDDLSWVQSAVDEAGKGVVDLRFTEEGRGKMADLFAQMNGRSIGLFVRDRLVSKLLVETDQLKDDIVIRDIPTAELAEVFADDVNVGNFVTFTPVP